MQQHRQYERQPPCHALPRSRHAPPPVLATTPTDTTVEEVQRGHKGVKRAHWSRRREDAPPARALPEGHASQTSSPSSKDVGAAFVPDQLPVKPKLTDAPGATSAFQPVFLAVTVVPDWVCSAFQS